MALTPLALILYTRVGGFNNPGPDPADEKRLYVKRLVEVRENVWAIEETKMNLYKRTMHQQIYNCYLNPHFFYTNKEKQIRTTYEIPDIINGASLWVAPKEEAGFTATLASFNYEQPGSTTRWFNWMSSKLMARDYYFFLKHKLTILCFCLLINN